MDGSINKPGKPAVSQFDQLAAVDVDFPDAGWDVCANRRPQQQAAFIDPAQHLVITAFQGGHEGLVARAIHGRYHYLAKFAFRVGAANAVRYQLAGGREYGAAGADLPAVVRGNSG